MRLWLRLPHGERVRLRRDGDGPLPQEAAVRFVELAVSKQNGAPRGLRTLRIAAEAIVSMEAQGDGQTTLLTMVNGDELRVRCDIAYLLSRISSEVDV